MIGESLRVDRCSVRRSTQADSTLPPCFFLVSSRPQQPNPCQSVSRATLSYALQELQIDVEKQLKELKVSEEERSRIREATKFGIFVVHNK